MARITSSSCSSLAALAVAGLLAAACGGSGGTDSGQPSPSPPDSSAAETPPSEGARAAPMGTSAVAGKIVFEGQAPRLKPIAMDADPACAAKHETPVASRALLLGEGQSLGNVFVQVTNAPGGNHAPPAEPVVVDQKGCIYEPHVLGVQVGQTLQVRNSDGLLHNVHGLAKVNREFNLGMPGTLTQSEMTFNKPEPLFKVKCDVHPWMHTYVAVMSHPYYAVTGESGEFRIEGLPAGDYEIEAWHEKLGTLNANVTVADAETATADFVFTVPSGG